MRNLRIVHDSIKGIKSDLPITSTTWDPGTDSVVFTLGPSPTQEVIEVRKVNATTIGAEVETDLIASWDAPCPLPTLKYDQVLCLHYFGDTERSCLVLAGGDIYTVLHSALPGEDKIQIVGSVDEGIAAAAWSPDDELLVLTTGAGTVLFMTLEFDQIASVELHHDDSKLSKHVSVGWGKVETQFKGKRARVIQDPTMPQRDEAGILSGTDDKKTTISWRGDGAFVAINSIIETGPRRMIRIYTRDGDLDSVTEPTDGLEGAMSWRPAGNLIAGIQRSNAEAYVAFFERNGLRHGKFSLRLSEAALNTWARDIRLFWNVDSSALAVVFNDRVQIWTMSNYHYYLKQEIIFGMQKENQPLSFSWHPEEPLRFAALEPYTGFILRPDTASCDSGPPVTRLRLVSMISTVSGGTHVQPHDYGTVVVIDGSSLRITPLRKANIPPPMAAHEIELDYSIKDVAVSKTGFTIAALHETAINILDWNPNDLSSAPRLRTVIELLPRPNTTICQLTFAGDDEIFTVSSGLKGFSLDKVGFESIETVHVFDAALPFSLSPSVDHNDLCISSGTSLRIFNTHIAISKSLESTTCQMPSPPMHTQVTRIGGELVTIGLTKTGLLFANSRHLVKNCTSFLVTPSHIILTTANHLLKFIHLTHVHELEVPEDAPETDERCRSVERGARLVTAMPTTYAAVLQMPRGNLETIYPRALVLASIRRNVELRQYGKAFRTCRTQRVDMNILHDYAPKQLLMNVKLFIEQLGSVEYVDLFLSSLNENDTSTTLYQETLPKASTTADQDIASKQDLITSTIAEGKVNRICMAFLAILKDMYETNLQNVITTNLSMIPPNIEAGLAVVVGLREKDESQAELALQHMCFLVDVNQVYERALGLYDLNLALLVAQQSQKDPREYLPYLQALREMEELRRNFSIDNDLKHYTKALGHLHSLKAFEEIKPYVQKHELYTQALDLYRYDLDHWKRILRLYADFLASRNRYREAAIAYESINDLQSALASYRAASLWRQALPVAMRIPLATEDLSSLAKDLIDSLLESKDFTAAATIALDHLQDVDSAVDHLCKAFRPREAIRIATVHKRQDLLGTTIDEGAREAAASLTKLMADCKSQVLAQTARLKEVRLIKENDPLHYLTGESSHPNNDRDFPDDMSIAPTESSLNPSLFTRYGGGGSIGSGTLASNTTRRTSKGKRREERKRARGKKGSIYEEEYLVNSIERLVARMNESHGDVEEVVEACMRRGMWEQARTVEGAVVEVEDLLEGRLQEVFGARAAKVAAVADAGGQGEAALGEQRPVGGDGVLWDCIEGMAKKEAPTLKKFTRSGLLG